MDQATMRMVVIIIEPYLDDILGWSTTHPRSSAIPSQVQTERTCRGHGSAYELRC